MRTTAAALAGLFALIVATTAFAADGGSTTTPTDGGGKVKDLDASVDATTSSDPPEDYGGCAIGHRGDRAGGTLLLGVKAVLIGETLMRSGDIGAKLRELRGSAPSPPGTPGGEGWGEGG